jgi:nucleotide-binding universal stress UspA family protein
MPTLRQILCPTDFSEFSKRALDHALALARWYDARLTVLHAFPHFLPFGGEMPYFAPGAALDAGTRSRLIEELGAFAAPAAAAGVVAETRLVEGDPSERIVEEARQLQADLVVVGTHGRRGFDRLLLGSVAERVVRKAPCPVLTVCRPQEEAAPVLYRRILCPLDLRGSSRTLELAASLAREARGRLTLLHVVEGVGDDDLAPVPFDVPAFRRYMEADARERLAAAVPDALRAACQTEEHVVVGRAHREILRAARELEADLVVMGVHAGGAPFGSTVQLVVREAPCPVLSVRAPA